MSVLVRGAKMPRACDECKFRVVVGCYGELPHNIRMPNCPLVKLSSHGDLIDRDELNKAIGVDVMSGWTYEHSIRDATAVIKAETCE